MEYNKIHHGNSLQVLKTFPNESINCVMTSPPYWALRDYGVEGQLGLEKTFQEYINNICDIFDEVKRVLRKDGTCWINIGDTYSGNKEGKTDNKVSDYLKDTTKNLHKKTNGVSEKSLCNIPARFSIEMQNRGWILRNVIIWYKPNCMPCSVKDRFTVDFEYVFFFVKSKKYLFETQYEKYTSNDPRPSALERARELGYTTKEKMYHNNGKDCISGTRKSCSGIRNSRNINGRNKRTVWRITTKPFKESHFATYPEELCYTPIKAGCPENGIVLDPFFGAGTTGLVALKQNKNFIGIELNPEYIKIANKRLEPYLRNGITS